MTEIIIFGAGLATMALVAWASARGATEPCYCALQHQHHQNGPCGRLR